MNKIYLDDYLQVEEQIKRSAKPVAQLSAQYGLTQEAVKEILMDKPQRQTEMPLPLNMPHERGVVEYKR
jgi:antitoxin component of RelBE/YafQ-DinJ toxin-antitoxin module